jgi:hypothetical protein
MFEGSKYHDPYVEAVHTESFFLDSGKLQLDLPEGPVVVIFVYNYLQFN